MRVGLLRVGWLHACESCCGAACPPGRGSSGGSCVQRPELALLGPGVMGERGEEVFYNTKGYSFRYSICAVATYLPPSLC